MPRIDFRLGQLQIGADIIARRFGDAKEMVHAQLHFDAVDNLIPEVIQHSMPPKPEKPCKEHEQRNKWNAEVQRPMESGGSLGKIDDVFVYGEARKNKDRRDEDGSDLPVQRIVMSKHLLRHLIFKLLFLELLRVHSSMPSYK